VNGRVGWSQITNLESQLKSGARASGRINEWFATHKPSDLVEDVQAGRVTFLQTNQVGGSVGRG
jgi:hypothetical protein